MSSPGFWFRSPQLANRNLLGLKVKNIEEALALPDDQIDLATAVLLLSQEASLNLDHLTFNLESYRDRINEMAQVLIKKIGKESDLLKSIDTINHYLFHELGFENAGEEEEDPKVNFLNVVLDEKKGNDLSLSILYLALAERIGIPLFGVYQRRHFAVFKDFAHRSNLQPQKRRMPGYILVKPDLFYVRSDDGQKPINFDPAQKGMVLADEYDCRVFKNDYLKNQVYLKSLGKKETIGILLVQRGEFYWEKELYDQAIADCSLALTINPIDDRAYYVRGMSYHEKDLSDCAIADYSKALELNPRYPEAYHYRGMSYANQGLFNKAIIDYTEVIKYDPANTHFYIERGRIYYSQDRFDEAIADFTSALELNPELFEIYSFRGVVYTKLGRFDEAIVDFNQSLEVNPHFADAYNNRGLAHYEKDCYDQAIVDFNQTLRFSPRNEEYYYNRALAFSMKGFLDQALADFNTVLELNPRFIMAFYSRAEIYEKMSYWKEAVGDYKVFLRFASRQHGPYIEQAQERILALKEK